MPQAPALQPENLSRANWQQPGAHSLPVLSVQQIRQLEEAAFRETDSFLLMQAAGIRSALKIAEQLSHADGLYDSCLVLAGPGNNGGDGCIVAGELKRKGFEVTLLQVTEGRQGSRDRMQAVLWALAHGVQPIEFQADMNLPTLKPGMVVVDALLGIACDRAPGGLIAQLIQHVNASVQVLALSQPQNPVRIYALDCPSGLNCDTGIAQGAVLQAHTTFTYLACKQGLLTGQGKGLSGEVWVEDLNCAALLGRISKSADFGPFAKALSRHEQDLRLPRRSHEHHKGSFGSVAVLGGQPGMTGACLLSARTALMLGAGRVALSLLSEQGLHLPDVQLQGHTPFLDVLFPEIMNKDLQHNLDFADTVVVGPGLGQSDEALNWLDTLLCQEKSVHMVWDADALNLLAQNESLRASLHRYRVGHPDCALVLTPHPLEAARLLGTDTVTVQSRRLDSAQALASAYGCTVVLKGAGTLIAQNGKAEINLTGGPALGTAGSGDVLAGAIAALLGQGLSEFEAAAHAAYLHGLALEPNSNAEEERLLVSHASEIAQRMKHALNRLLNQAARRNHQLT